MTEGFVKPPHRALVLVETDPAALLGRFATFAPPRTGQRIAPDERLTGG